MECEESRRPSDGAELRSFRRWRTSSQGSDAYRGSGSGGIVTVVPQMPWQFAA
jgi:hypothetical protein